MGPSILVRTHGVDRLASYALSRAGVGNAVGEEQF